MSDVSEAYEAYSIPKGTNDKELSLIRLPQFTCLTNDSLLPPYCYLRLSADIGDSIFESISDENME